MTVPKVAAIIPSRYGSTRLPGKALKPIGAKPMIQRVYERAKLAKHLASLTVATDDERIARVVEAFGGRYVMTSPDHPSGTDRLAEAVLDIDADIVVNVQGDQPFLDPLMIDEAVQPLLDEPELQMSTLMHPIAREEDLNDPAVVKVVTNRKGDALYFSRSLIPYPRQNVDHNVFEHVGLYVYRKDFLLKLSLLPPTLLERIESLEQLRVLEHGYVIRVIQTKVHDNAFSGFSVDTEDDLLRAETMLRERGLE
ncbi:MAG: 3-deoxy-manno-octulosonate cytidylyltransferase [Candidatus Hydrogenedentes bacterium]|nr:3-deoxy-manno-octulosonate cytidylyltransferase [Candidatus Hydrogenedentota bacterium]